MNEYFIHQRRYNTVKTVKRELCRPDRKAQRALTTALKDTLMKKLAILLLIVSAEPFSLFVVFSFRHSHTHSELHLKADGVSVSAV